MDKKEKYIDDDGYIALANAIIMQAVKDYRKALRKKDTYIHNSIAPIEKFFRSEHFKMLTSINSEMLIKRLRAEVENV